MTSRLALVEFPADDASRARTFWGALLGIALEPRNEGEGWQTPAEAPAVGVHERGRGPGDSFSLAYFEVDDMSSAQAQVRSLGGSVIHPGELWAICRDTEGSPFGLALRAQSTQR
jgi:uncharacterized protein